MVIPDDIQGRYFLAGRHDPVTPSDRCWDDPLPSARDLNAFPAGPTDLTYGLYFTALNHFLSRNRFEAPLQAATRYLGRNVRLSDIARIDICLEKHGQFYHPARIQARIGTDVLSFVVNVAVSRDGRRCLTADVENIQRLLAEYPYQFLPQMYAIADVPTAAGHGTLTMALGEWLTGFYEFHFSDQGGVDHPVVLVWETENGPTRLSEQQVQTVFRKAARILTAYLNIEHFVQIQNWHNAAGDFVIRQDGGKIRVRLITVRRYAPLFEGLAVTAENVLDLLVVYLVNTALRLGLDRLDGTGEPAWGGGSVLSAALQGCLDGLQLQVDYGILPVQLLDGLIRYLKAYPVEELDGLCYQIVNRWPSATIGRDLIQDRLGSLGAAIGHAIQRLEQPL